MARVFLAGASGAIGRRLIPMLRAGGHEVTGTTRSAEKAELVRGLGAEPVVVDALDSDALRSAVADASPKVVINQLTALPQTWDVRNKTQLEDTNVLRTEVAPVLTQAAIDAGARRLIVQSIAFVYAPEGDSIKDEDAPLGTSNPAIVQLERSTLDSEGIDALVLRYGWLYGEGTWYASEGSIANDVRRRRYPQIGKGSGVFSFVHVDDAASATVAAVDRGEPGIYNVVDDDPAPTSEWLPEYADVLGAKKPMRVPVWLASLVAGKDVARQASELRGASNAKAKAELGWEPRFPSWRRGFREALG